MVKATMMTHKVSLTPAQMKKLMKGDATLLKHEQMEGGEIEIHLHAKKHRRLMKNLTGKKGYKLQLSPEEMEGGNLREFFGKVGKVVRNVAKKVAPVVLPALAGVAATAIGQPELAPIATAVTRRLVGKGEGIKHSRIHRVHHHRSFKGAVGEPHGGKLESNYNTFLNTEHPAMHPLLPPHDQSYSPMTHGGSFLAAGEGLHRHHHQHHGGGIRGSPMSPILPQGDMSLPRKV